LRAKGDGLFSSWPSAIPVGGSPTGAGESPALPSFQVPLERRRRVQIHLLSRHVYPTERSHAPAEGSAWIDVPDTRTVAGERAIHCDWIPRNRSMPVNEQGCKPVSAVRLRQGATVDDVDLALVFWIGGVAFHDDFLRRILHLADGPFVRGLHPVAPLREESHPIPVGIWAQEIVRLNPIYR